MPFHATEKVCIVISQRDRDIDDEDKAKDIEKNSYMYMRGGRSGHTCLCRARRKRAYRRRDGHFGGGGIYQE